MIAAYRAGQLLAPFTVEGACHRTVFEIWLETGLMPVLKPGDWVLVDDATFHHGERRKALIEAVGAQVVYLPRPIPLTSTVLRKVGPG
jgi:transposase